MGPSPNATRAIGWALLLLLALGLAATRTSQLDLDPPSQILEGYRGKAHFRDEVAKAHESRNKALFGEFHLSPADEYAFWRAQSPAWVWGQVAWFRTFGVTVVQSRSFVVVQTLVALAVLAWLVIVRRGWPAGLAALALFGFCWPYLIYSRLALMEGSLICWLLVGSVGLAQLERRPEAPLRWSLLAACGLLVACGVKQTALLLAPLFVVALVMLGRRSERPKVVFGVAAGIVIALAIFVLRPEYQERLAFNADHFTGADESSAMASAPLVVWRGIWGGRLALMFVRLAPVLLPLAALEVLRQAWAYRRQRAEPDADRTGLYTPADGLDLFAAAWFVLALAANLASPHRAIRFQLIMLPPAAILSASFFAHALAHAGAKRTRVLVSRAVLTVLVVAATWMNLRPFSAWMESEDRSATTVGHELRELIGDREAVVVGEFAAQAVFETNYRHFYVRPKLFNHDRETLEALGITHVVFNEKKDFVRDVIRNNARGLVNGWKRLGKVRYRSRRLLVRELRPRRSVPD